MSVLREEYINNSNPVFVQQIDWLIANGYVGVRRTRPDGEFFLSSQQSATSRRSDDETMHRRLFLPLYVLPYEFFPISILTTSALRSSTRFRVRRTSPGSARTRHRSRRSPLQDRVRQRLRGLTGQRQRDGRRVFGAVLGPRSASRWLAREAAAHASRARGHLQRHVP